MANSFVCDCLSSPYVAWLSLAKTIPSAPFKPITSVTVAQHKRPTRQDARRKTDFEANSG